MLPCKVQELVPDVQAATAFLLGGLIHLHLEDVLCMQLGLAALVPLTSLSH